MGYPGDQGKPGGRPHRQPPHTPYGPGAEAPPYGHAGNEAPFAPRDAGPGAMPPGGGPPGGPFGGEPFDGDQFDGDQFDGDRFEDPYGAAAGLPPMPSGPPPPERRRNLPLIIGGAAVAGLLLIAGGIGLSSVLEGDSEPEDAKPSQAATPTPTPSPTKPVLAAVKLKNRITDPKPLTAKEVFGNGKFEARGHKYVRTAVSSKKSCTGVVGGRALEKALKQGDCTQALRATYALTKGQLIGTVGVFNLETEAAAAKAVKAAADKDAFLQALPGKGITRTNGRGEALGTSQARGHYLLMTWVQRPDGKKIAKKYHDAVRIFGVEMVKGSNLALALHYRETEGKPLQK
ncbi:hypothetical protein [Spirillospora sp. NPDC048823]|uniref:hypothetical protein n=1 Tax=unclassified Spirillospora TaxID=2642701 RepID=UPI003710D494